MAPTSPPTRPLRWPLFVLLLVVMAPAASALQFSAAPATPPSLDWALGQPADERGPQVPTDLGAAREVVAFVPLGDVDADGRLDVLMQVVDLKSGTVVYSAVSGTQLSAAGELSAAADLPDVWRMAAGAGTGIVPSGDLDADGTLDHLLVQASSSVQAVQQGAGGAAAQRVTATGEVVFSPLGVRGQALFDQRLPTSLDHVRSGAAGAVDLAQERITEQRGQVEAVAQGAVFSVQEQVDTTRTILPALPTSTLTEVQNDVTIEFLDASGAVRATVELADPNVNVAGMLAADLDLDGVADGVVMQVQKVSPVQENPAVRPVLTALDGATGSVAWEIEFEAVAGVPVLLPDLGDLDGDGTSDLAVLEQVTQAGTADPSSVLRVLSGASGQTIGTLEDAQGVVGLLPLGDLDADGVMEALKFVDPNNGPAVVAAVDARLQAAWSIELPNGQFPLNAVENPFTGELAGFQDWTLDGVPDIAVGQGLGLDTSITDGKVDVALHTGTDGSLAWDATFTEVVDAAIVADLSASASQDIALVQSMGLLKQAGDLAEVEGLALTLVRGADGVGIWRLPLVPADAIPAGTAALADVRGIGDVNGDAVEDLQVHLEFTAKTGASVVDTGATKITTAADATAHTYVISGIDGKVLASHADAVEDLSVPLQAPGPVEALAAYRGSEAVQDGDAESPLPGIVVVLAALVAVVAWRRR